jgi:NDP-sugar pyrophosphorylase family protein
MMTVAILAGGLATRLHPITHTIPKALVQVAGEPFAHHQLRLLARNGIRDVVYLIGHLGEQIVETLGDGQQFGLNIRYLPDGPRLMGTAGALVRARPLLGDHFGVLYGDSYLDCDYRAIASAFTRSGKPALMTVFANDGQWDQSNVDYADGIIRTYSKTDRTAAMRHIDYGFGLFKADVFDGLAADEPADLAPIYSRLASLGQLAAFEATKRFYEVGSLSGISELETYLSNTREPA